MPQKLIDALELLDLCIRVGIIAVIIDGLFKKAQPFKSPIMILFTLIMMAGIFIQCWGGGM